MCLERSSELCIIYYICQSVYVCVSVRIKLNIPTTRLVVFISAFKFYIKSGTCVCRRYECTLIFTFPQNSLLMHCSEHITR